MNNTEALKQDLSIGLFSDDPNSIHNREIEASGARLDEVEASVVDLERNRFVATATWGLEDDEKVYRLTPSPTATLEERRAAILANERSRGGSRLPRLKAVLESYGYTVQVTQHFAEYLVEIKITSPEGRQPAGYEEAAKAARKLIHSHLGIEFKFSFLLVKDIHNSMNINQLQATPLKNFSYGGV